MNQILQTENKKNNGPVEIGKVIKFFVVAIIIFAIILIGLGAYHLITQNNNQTPTEPVVEEQPPQVNINREEDDIVIEIIHNKPIAKIVYNWNEEQENTIEANNQTTISERITLPYGTNTLNLTVTDINGIETKFQKEYVVEGDGKPVIELKLTQDNKIKITAQDKSNLKDIMYSWNDGEQTKIEATGEDLTKVEQEIEIPLGQNTLKVQATNINDVTTTKELQVKGIKKPVLSFKKEGDYLVIKAEDEVGMKVIDYTLNGQKYQINYGNKKVIEYKQLLQKGENNLEIKAENQDGGITTKKVKVINN